MEGGRKEDSTTSGAMAAGFMNFPENDTTDYTLNELKLTPRHPNQASVRTLTEIEQFLIDNAAPDPPENSSSPADSIPPPHVHTHSYIHATELELKHLQRRIDLRIVPICATLYLLCFLCRQNIGNAKTYHMKETLPVNSTEYQLALTVFFLTYSTFDIPCNILMRKLGPRVWLPSIALISGVVTACMGLVKNSGELIGVRAVLGMAECGLFPGVAMVITMWYVKKEAQLRQALFFCAARYAQALFLRMKLLSSNIFCTFLVWQVPLQVYWLWD